MPQDAADSRLGQLLTFPLGAAVTFHDPHFGMPVLRHASFAHRAQRTTFDRRITNALGDKKTSQEARQCLVELRPAELPALYAQAKNDSVGVREGLAEIIGMLGDSQAIPVLQELGKDHRGQISALANQAIRRITARTGG